MDRDQTAAHLALKGGIAVRYSMLGHSPDYALFVPGHHARWACGLRTTCPVESRDVAGWQDRAVHLRDIPDPIYDQLVELAIQEGAL